MSRLASGRLLAKGVSAVSSAIAEVLERRTLMAFGLTTSTNSYTVDTGAGLVFSIARTTASSAAVGDLTSTVFNGTQLEAPFSATSRYSHYESGLSSSAVVTATVDPAATPQWIEISCDDTGATGVGVIQYYIARKGFANIYMATYAPGPNSPSPGEMRFITYTNHSVLTNAPAPSNNTGNTGAIESSDVFGFADGTTSSKYYGEYRAIDTQTYGLTGGGFGEFMNIGNRETSSGGPFFKDIDFQTTSSQSTELYTYTFSGHSQTENFRPGLHGPYALQFTTGATPAAPDYSFIDGIGLTGEVPASGRGPVIGTASGVPAGQQVTVGLSNAAAQYWATPNAGTGAYTISGVLPGTYTETIYAGELAVGTTTITVSAGATTAQNITDTNYIPPEIFHIGTWDGTPIGFLNADKIGNMHPSDTRMSAWADSTGMTNFTVGTSADSSWPMAEWKEPQTAAPFTDTINRITFTLTAAQATTAMTLRINLTRAGAGGRPIISINGGSFSSAPASSTQPSSRGVTTGNWRGNNVLYTYTVSTSSVHSGTNTIDIEVASGSSDTDPWLGPWYIYDAIDLVTTSSLTNAPHVSTISVTPANPTVLVNAQEAFTATAKDQFGNMTPANFAWSDTSGVIDGTGLYTAPATAGSDTVKATSGALSGQTTVTIAPPLQVNSGNFQYLTSQSVVIAFNKDITPSLLLSAFTLKNLTTQTTIAPASIQLNYANLTATFTFTSILPDGNYLATIPASATLNSSGEHLASDYTFSFFTLIGDTNHDGTVNVTDLGNLATNFGLTSGANWSEGDFDYNGAVNVADLGDLASNFGASLVGGTAAAAGSAVVTADAQGSAAPTPSIAMVAVAAVPPSPFSDLKLDADDRKHAMLEAIGLA